MPALGADLFAGSKVERSRTRSASTTAWPSPWWSCHGPFTELPLADVGPSGASPVLGPALPPWGLRSGASARSAACRGHASVLASLPEDEPLWFYRPVEELLEGKGASGARVSAR